MVDSYFPVSNKLIHPLMSSTLLHGDVTGNTKILFILYFLIFIKYLTACFHDNHSALLSEANFDGLKKYTFAP